MKIILSAVLLLGSLPSFANADVQKCLQQSASQMLNGIMSDDLGGGKSCEEIAAAYETLKAERKRLDALALEEFQKNGKLKYHSVGIEASEDQERELGPEEICAVIDGDNKKITHAGFKNTFSADLTKCPAHETKGLEEYTRLMLDENVLNEALASFCGKLKAGYDALKEQMKAECPAPAEQAGTGDQCKDEALVKLKELLANDEKGLLQHQFQLTAAKTALYLKENLNGKTNVAWESFVKKEQANIVTDEAVTKAKALYQEYGITEDYAGLDKVEEGILNKNYSYYKVNSRLYNDDASKFYLLLAANPKEGQGVKFGMEDAAIAWMFHKISEQKKYKKGGHSGNLHNLSNHVNKYMGHLVAGGTDKSQEDLAAIIEREKGPIRQEIKTVMESLESCKDRLGEECLIDELHSKMFAQDMLSASSQVPLEKDVKITSYVGRATAAERQKYDKAPVKKPEAAVTQPQEDVTAPVNLGGNSSFLPKSPGGFMMEPYPWYNGQQFSPYSKGSIFDLQGPQYTSTFGPTLTQRRYNYGFDFVPATENDFAFDLFSESSVEDPLVSYQDGPENSCSLEDPDEVFGVCLPE